MVPQHWRTCSLASCAWAPACSVHLETGRQREGEMKGPCMYTQVEAGADMLPCVLHQLPAHISNSRRDGKAAVRPGELQPSWCLLTRHTWGIQELSSTDVVDHPKWQRTTGSWHSGNTHFEHIGTMSRFFKEGTCPKVSSIQDRMQVDISLKFVCFKYWLYLCG